MIVNNCGIYQITNKMDNKFYLGSSSNLKNREKAHYSYLQKGKHPNRYLQKAYNEIVLKYDLNKVRYYLEFSIIEVIPDQMDKESLKRLCGKLKCINFIKKRINMYKLYKKEDKHEET